MVIPLGGRLPGRSSSLTRGLRADHPSPPLPGDRPPIWPCTGWGLPSRSGHPDRWCALTAPFHPYRAPVRARGGLFSVALSVGSPPLAVSQHPALRCPDFPPARRFTPGRRPSGSLWRRPVKERDASVLYAARRPPGLGVGPDQLRPLLGDHLRRRVGVARGDPRHHRGVDDAQPRRRRGRGAGRPRPPRDPAPMRHVPTGWKIVVPSRRRRASRSASDSTAGPGRHSSGAYRASAGAAMIRRVKRIAATATCWSSAVER